MPSYHFKFECWKCPKSSTKTFWKDQYIFIERLHSVQTIYHCRLLTNISVLIFYLFNSSYLYLYTNNTLHCYQHIYQILYAQFSCSNAYCMYINILNHNGFVCNQPCSGDNRTKDTSHNMWVVIEVIFLVPLQRTLKQSE